MKHRVYKLFLSSLALIILLFTIPHTAFAIVHSSGAHSSGGHSSTSHATTSHSVTTHNITNHSTTYHNTVSSPRLTSKENVPRSVQGNKTSAQNKAIIKASHSSTYSSLHSVSQKQNYLNWHSNYCEVNAHNATHYFTNVNYFWMPSNLWHTALIGNRNNDTLMNQMLSQAKQRKYKWLQVDNKMVAVPPHLYNKIHVGDHVRLIDDNTIEVNGKVCS